MHQTIYEQDTIKHLRQAIEDLKAAQAAAELAEFGSEPMAGLHEALQGATYALDVIEGRR